jgi:Ca2+-binding RTX toxin-like protein
LAGGSGNDALNGGNGTDTAIYTGASAGVTVSLAVTSAQNTGGDGTDTLNSVENLVGSSFDDSLTGNSANNVLNGAAGDDILTGGSGADIFRWTTDSLNSPDAPFTDTITDFSRTQGDKLDLSAVLTGDSSDDLSDYLTFATLGSDVVVSVYADGNPSGIADITITLEGQSGDLIALQQYLLTQNGVIH